MHVTGAHLHGGKQGHQGHGFRRFRRSVRIFFGGGWWDWSPDGWYPAAVPIVCSQWSQPLDVDDTFRAYAQSQLAASQGQPVSERLADGWLYLYTLESGNVVVRRCWTDTGGTMGDAPPRPPESSPSGGAAPTNGARGDLGTGTMGDAAPAGSEAVPTVVAVERPHPRGMRGVREGAAEVAARIARDARNTLMITWARRAIAEANLPGVRGAPVPDQLVGALFQRLKSETAFVKDPVNTELMMSATQLLCLDPRGYCVRAGDCDDMLIALGAAVATLGIPVWIRVRRYRGQSQAHITLLYDSAPRLGGPIKCVDPSTDSGACSEAPYVEEVVMEVDMGQHDEAAGTFIGIGDPPPPELPPDQTSAWITQIQNAKAALDASRARLVAAAAQFAKVRADLGLPDHDPSLGENASTSALADYLRTQQWTPEAAAAESKLLATATFLSTVLSDGLAGQRAMYWKDADIAFASKAGDAYGVMLVTDANGNKRLSYVDPQTGAPTGTIGIAPILIGLAIVGSIVVTVAAVWAVSKVVDYMTSAHRDDMLGKVAEQQQSLVDQGKSTPAQAAAFMRAMGDLAAATAPPPPENLITKYGLPLLGIALGLVGGYIVARFAGAVLPAMGGRPAQAAEGFGLEARSRPSGRATARRSSHWRAAERRARKHWTVITVDEKGWTRGRLGRRVSRVQAERVAAMWRQSGVSNVRIVEA